MHPGTRLHPSYTLLVVLAVSHVCGDWVEIPYLQPKTTTQRTTVIRKTISQLQKPEFTAGSGFLSQVLPQTSSGESDHNSEEYQEEYPSESTQQSDHRKPFHPLGNRFVPNRGSVVSDLMDYEEFVQSATTTEKPGVNRFEEETYHESGGSGGNLYGNFQKKFYEYPRFNVSSKLGWGQPPDQHQFVTANRNPAIPFPQDHQPLSNKYEEESIEYLHTDIPVQRPAVVPTVRPQAQFVNDRVEVPTPEDDDQGDSYESSESSSEEQPAHHVARPAVSHERDFNGPTSEEPEKDRFPDFDDYDVKVEDDDDDDDREEQRPLRNSSVKFVRRKRPGQVTIVKIIPPRRRFRPIGEGGGFAGFLKFLKRMQDGFMLNTAKSIGDKIKLLQNLKDQLLLSIERKMTILWGNPAQPGTEKVGRPGTVTKVDRKGHRRKDQQLHRRRTKRGGDWLEDMHSQHHGGMEFPSAEAALLTISFLTFAVFLIKLVLQVINAIKAKHYTYTALNGMTPVTAATLKLVKRTKRSEDAALSDQQLHILSAINSYKFTGN